MRGWLRSALLIACITAVAAVSAQSAPYTVQVVALSDLDAAQRVQTDLLRDGYPAYIVRSTSAQGDVWRVRVGAFANRQATLLYASGMPEIAGAQPVPALAEAIPAGIMPLAPHVLLDEELTGRSVTIGTSGDQLILRFQEPPGSGEAEVTAATEPAAEPPAEPTDRAAFQPAEYVIIVGNAIERRRAWRFGEVDGAHLWVREALLWPATWRDETDEVRQGFRTSLLRLLAERLGVSVAEVEAATYLPDPAGAPMLIVVELEAPDQPDGVRLLGLGLPASGFDADGPLEYLGISREELPPALATLSVDELLAEPTEPVIGEGFTATSDGAYIRLDVDGASWRAVLGHPLWSDGQRLLASIDDRLLVYGFVRR